MAANDRRNKTTTGVETVEPLIVGDHMMHANHILWPLTESGRQSLSDFIKSE